MLFTELTKLHQPWNNRLPANHPNYSFTGMINSLKSHRMRVTIDWTKNVVTFHSDISKSRLSSEFDVSTVKFGGGVVREAYDILIDRHIRSLGKTTSSYASRLTYLNQSTRKSGPRTYPKNSRQALKEIGISVD